MHAIDFDDTLNFVKGNLPNYALIDYLTNLNEPFVILTARRNTESNLKYIQKFCEDNEIYPEDIYFTDGKLKGDKLKELNIEIFIDNDPDQLASCMENEMISCLHPDDILNIKTAGKKKRDPKVGTGKKPKGSGRRLYTDENPKDTCRVSFTSVSAIQKTFSSPALNQNLTLGNLKLSI